MKTLFELACQVGALTAMVAVAALASDALPRRTGTVYVRAHMRNTRYYGALSQQPKNQNGNGKSGDALWFWN